MWTEHVELKYAKKTQTASDFFPNTETVCTWRPYNNEICYFFF